MKVLYLLLVFLLFGCSGNNIVVVRENIEQQTLQNALRSTVAIINNRVNSNTEVANVSCAAFFVSPRIIVGALHCFQVVEYLETTYGSIQAPTRINPVNDVHRFARYGDIDFGNRHFTTDTIHQAKVIAIDQNADIAILELMPETASSTHYLSIGVSLARLTQRVYLIGHPIGMVWSTTDGIVSRTFQMTNGATYTQTNIGVIGGYSGGPLLDIDGNVVGMANYYVGNMHHLSLFISSERIAHILLNRN
jgi:V8-like Glu-specific endopeptidase